MAVVRSRGNLPADMTSFVGRIAEQGGVVKLLRSARLVTLTGTGGVGKTRLALRAAKRTAGRFADGVWLVELSELQDPELLAHEVCGVLGVRDQTARQQVQVLADHLADKQVLLLLDTCEHLVDHCAALSAYLLRSAPGLRILATSRQPLGLPGEHILPVEPLRIEQEAVRLFTERARAVHAGLDVTGPVLELCDRLQGLPLAIELAAAQTGSLTVEEILSELESRRLDGLTRTGVPRHQSMRTTVGWSHELCEPLERLLWARLSVFVGSFAQDGVITVCSHRPLTPESALRTLRGLVDKSIVQRLPGGRYRMLDTIRAYGREWLGHLGDEQQLRRRHRDYYLGLARWFNADWRGPEQFEWADRMAGELANLRIAFDYCWSHPDDFPTGLDLAASLVYFWVACGHVREGRHQLDRALSRCPQPSYERTAALWACAFVAMTQGDHHAAQRMLDEAGVAAAWQDDALAGAYVLTMRAMLAMLRGALDDAVILATDAADIHRGLGDTGFGVLLSLSVHALSLMLEGRDLTTATGIVEEMWQISDTFGGRWVRSYADHHLSGVRLAQGDPDGAEELALRCLETKWRLHDTVGTALVLDLLARIAVARGDGRTAARLLGLSQQVWSDQGAEAVAMGSAQLSSPREQCVSAARELVGDEGFEALYGEGREVNLGEAIGALLAGK
ncbi:ATP-binding protein [Nonomuraea soli]|uniref:Non-specific serine/threonine protein kinase n=1 Tax=Nonomuraea soli TaxID=1032476 RepID=A0A7W0CM22_9ACTN|nr:AAA family ATPase [Nonomuraea soli]MBA2893596.1 non-specific serine/threonine protein kinase [Nonomuraea soli]